jgi:hypothetical protein
MSLCTGKPHADSKPCRGVQTIPPECFKCGTMQHFGFDVNYYPDVLPHWQCQRCHGGYWFWTPDDDSGWVWVYRGDELVVKFMDEDDADDYISQKNALT